ncbi:MAG TPA: hypothetical protein VIV82_00525 [Verrucomicrobiae bacterium]
MRQIKNPLPVWQWVESFLIELQPDCRAAQQRVRKQQVEMTIHEADANNGSADGQMVFQQ